jgi:hypothetical protein
MVRDFAASCARAASGHAAAPPSAASNSRRPMVTVIRPLPREVRKGKDTTSRAYSLAVQGGQHASSFDLSLRLQLHYSRRQLFANARHRGLARRPP